MKRILAVLFVLFAATGAFAQTTWSWTQYSISFTLPDDFEIGTNTGDEFSASDGYIDFSIFPFNDESISADDIGQYTVGIGMTLDIDDGDADMLDLNGFEGAYVEGVSEGQRIVVLGLIDPDGATNFYATIAFEEGDNESMQIAIDILKSISKK